MANKEQFEHLLKYKKEQRETHTNYIRGEMSNLVNDCDLYGYQIQIHDGYGNKTKYLRISKEHLREIKNILNHPFIN